MLIFSICVNYFSSINFYFTRSIFFVVRMNCIYLCSLSRNPVCTQEQTGSRTYMSEKTAKRNEDNRSLHFHVANFFKFMAANLSFTQFVT